jgi:hypothetical protein
VDGPLSKPQTKLLAFIRDYTTTHGYPPCVRDMLPVGPWVSTSTVAYHLKILTKLGYITRNTKSRTITVLDGDRPTTEAPMDSTDAARTIRGALRTLPGTRFRDKDQATRAAQRIVDSATEPGATDLVVLAVGSEISARRLLNGATLAFPPADPVAPTEEDMAEARLVLTQLAATYQETRTDGTRLRDQGQETATP